MPRQWVELGSWTISDAARKALTKEDVQIALCRHMTGDGAVDAEDKQYAYLNAGGSREKFISLQRAADGTSFVIMTVPEQSHTTVLLFSEV